MLVLQERPLYVRGALCELRAQPMTGREETPEHPREYASSYNQAYQVILSAVAKGGMPTLGNQWEARRLVTALNTAGLLKDVKRSTYTVEVEHVS